MEESLSLAGDTCGEVVELVKDSGEVDKKLCLLLLASLAGDDNLF